MVTEMKNAKFNNVDDAQWKETAIKSLRGIPFEKLITNTVEGVDIQPLYTKEQIEDTLQNQEAMIQTIRKGIQTPDWIIAQQSYITNSSEFLSEVKESLDKGNEAIVYDGSRQVSWTNESLKELAKLIQVYPLYAFRIQENDSFLEVFSMIEESERKNVKGVVSGATIGEGYHLVRTSAADTVDAHLKGADAVTELALSLTIAAEKAEKFQSFTQFESQFFVRFAIDTDFFMEIAKLRAFRVLWQTFASAYKVEKASTVPIISETSLRTYSKLDPYVNLLRAGNEALSAVLGGTDVLTVHPHNVLSNVTKASVRNARNVQSIIREETYVQFVLDPSGGSYFIDTLTNALIEKAWKLFQEIESIGGYSAYVTSGKLDSRLENLYEERVNKVNTGKKSLIGTNVYAELLNNTNEGKPTLEVPGRLSAPYEELRKSLGNNQPKTVLLRFGQLKEFKARADFVSGFLATGGIDVTESPAFQSVDAAKEWLTQNKFDYGIICSAPNHTVEMLHELFNDLPIEWLDVAGKYEPKVEAEWREVGIDGFIYKGQDQLEKLTAIQKHWEMEG